MAAPPVVVRVQMPERGVFLVRCPHGVSPRVGEQAIVALDYGEDVGVVKAVEALPKGTPPAFQYVRARTSADAAHEAANAQRAQTLRDEFLDQSRRTDRTLRVPYARLAFGGGRFFLGYATADARADMSRAVADLRQRYGLSVHARRLGPRDEVAWLGAIGPCGRPCCCATWQTHPPAGLTADRCRGCAAGAQHGVCGRFKCCLAFERDGDLQIERTERT